MPQKKCVTGRAQNLSELLTYNRIAAVAISHEVRNVCSAISMLWSNLRKRDVSSADADLQAFFELIAGLEKIAAFQLQSWTEEKLESVPLQDVLDKLRIIVEPEWRDIDGVIRWPADSCLPHVLADPHGLLQALLNLTQNSRRAVQASSSRELAISVSTEKAKT